MQRRRSVLGLLVLGALLVAPAGSARPDEPAEKDKKTTKADSKKKETHKEHKLTAAEEVSDQDKEWHLFHELGGGISVPMGWFEIPGTRYKVPTKYMILMVIAGSLIVWIFVKLARRVQTGEPVQGPVWNLFESFLTFIRDEVAKPNFPEHKHHHDAPHGAADAHKATHDDHAEEAVGGHPADKFVPFLWTLFLFILFCNLLGLLPFMGSPTANIYMTGGLALIAFVVMHGAPIAKVGLFSYLKSQWPAFEMPIALGIFIKPMIFAIELFGTVIKSGVLAIRLFANMFAGHMVLASILLFILEARAASTGMWTVVTVSSVLGVVALSMLELFVAFLQAYIFVFLTALFMGMLLNPEH